MTLLQPLPGLGPTGQPGILTRSLAESKLGSSPSLLHPNLPARCCPLSHSSRDREEAGIPLAPSPRRQKPERTVTLPALQLPAPLPGEQLPSPRTGTHHLPRAHSGAPARGQRCNSQKLLTCSTSGITTRSPAACPHSGQGAPLPGLPRAPCAAPMCLSLRGLANGSRHGAQPGQRATQAASPPGTQQLPHGS